MILLDGFDRYTDQNNTTLNQFWTPSTSGTNVLAISTEGRFGAGAVRLKNLTTITSRTLTQFDVSKATRIAFWLYVEALPNVNSSNEIVTFFSSGTSESGHISILSDGSIRIKVWTGTTLGNNIALTDPVIIAGTWHHIEIDITYATVAGGNYAIIWVDDVQKFAGNNALAVLTSSSAGMTTVDKVIFTASTAASGALATWFDDPLVWQYSPDNPFFLETGLTPLGSHRINTYSPIADGAINLGSPSGECEAWDCVNDPLGNDGDTTYILDEELERDQFLTNPRTYRPYALIVNAVSKRDGVSATEMELFLIDPSGSEFSDTIPITAGYLRYQSFHPRQADGAIWTTPPVAVEFGILAVTDDVRTTQMYLEELITANLDAALFSEDPPSTLDGFVPKMQVIL